jgi:hypothetical protein
MQLEAFPIRNSAAIITAHFLPISHFLSIMKSIVLSSVLAVLGCIALSLAAAVLAGTPSVQTDSTGAAPPAVHSTPKAG